MVVPAIESIDLPPSKNPTKIPRRFPRHRTKKSDSLGCVVSGGRKRCKPWTVAPLRQSRFTNGIHGAAIWGAMDPNKNPLYVSIY